MTKNLTKIYKTKSSRVNALSDANITINAGEFVAIVGTSGSGKSTLLSLLAGLEKPTSGKILIKGKAIHKMSEEKLVNFRLRHVGFVFQYFNLFPEMTALENAAFALNCKGMSRTKRHRIAKEILTELGLKKQLTHRPDELSGGQQQRVAIVRAIISKPEIVFADEPTGNLDTKTSALVIELLHSLVRSNNSTLIMVTHDIEKAKFADRIIYIEDGVIHEENIHKKNMA